MVKPPVERDVFKILITTFINSFKPKYYQRGTLIGTDYFGNKYYEIAARPSEGKRRASRWFEPQDKEKFDQEMPAEWEAWLRGRRKEPPAEQEIMKNVAIMQMKKQNAAIVDAKGGVMTPMVKGRETFPDRIDYELTPGKPNDLNHCKN